MRRLLFLGIIMVILLNFAYGEPVLKCMNEFEKKPYMEAISGRPTTIKCLFNDFDINTKVNYEFKIENKSFNGIANSWAIGIVYNFTGEINKDYMVNIKVVLNNVTYRDYLIVKIINNSHENIKRKSIEDASW